jgi:hypothetical protein
MYLFCRKLGFCLQAHMYIINYDKPFGLLKDLLIICLTDSFLIQHPINKPISHEHTLKLINYQVFCHTT